MRTKEELPECPVATAVSLIGGKWKLLLLRNLKERPWRFNELQRSIDLQTLAITINQSLIGHDRYYEAGFGAPHAPKRSCPKGARIFRN